MLSVFPHVARVVRDDRNKTSIPKRKEDVGKLASAHPFPAAFVITRNPEPPEPPPLKAA